MPHLVDNLCEFLAVAALNEGRSADYLANYSELGREKMWSRIHLIPLLQAENDRDQVRRYWADQDREQELLGKKTKIYHSDRYDCCALIRIVGQTMLMESI